MKSSAVAAALLVGTAAPSFADVAVPTGPSVAPAAGPSERLASAHLVRRDGMAGTFQLTGLTSRYSGDPAVQAQLFLAEFGPALGLPPVRELVAGELTAVFGGHVAAFGWQVDGLPVLDASLKVYLSKGQVRLVNGQRMVQAQPAQRAVLALDELTRRAQAAVPAGEAATGEPEPKLGWTLAGGALEPTASVLLHTVNHDLEVRVHAVTGEVLRMRDLRAHARANVFQDPKDVLPGTFQEVDLLNLTTPSQGLVGKWVNVFNCTGGTQECISQRGLRPDANGDFLTRPAPLVVGNQFAETQMYFHVDRMHGFFSNELGYQGGRFDSASLPATVNYLVDQDGDRVPDRYDNAFYSPGNSGPGAIKFGLGESVNYAYDGDVIDHEYTHYIVGLTADLNIDFDEYGLVSFPPAINEGTADYFSATEQGDSAVGEYAGRAAGGWRGPGTGTDEPTSSSIRDLSDRNACPGDIAGESHEDGKIWGGASWDLRNALGRRQADAVLFAALVASTSSAGFQELGVATQAAIETQGSPLEIELTRGVLATRGLDRCSRWLKLGSERVSGYLYPGYYLGALGRTVGFPSPLNYEVEIPAGSKSVTISFSPYGPAKAYWRLDEKVLFDFGRTGQDITVISDGTMLATGGREGRATLTIDSAKLGGQAHRLFITPANTYDYDNGFRLSAAIERPTPEQPATTASSSSGSSSGSSSTGGSSSGGTTGGLVESSGSTSGGGTTGTDGTAVGGGCSSTAGGPLLALLFAGLGLFGRRRNVS